MTEVEAWRMAAWALGAAVMVLVVLWWRASTRVRRRNAARQRIAKTGEEQAEALLVSHGFEVVDRQVTGAWTMRVDGVAHEVRCRADLIVRPRRDRRRRYVAEVKTGARAVTPTLPATRRQLLEYTFAFEVDGVLLLDMEARVLHTVEF